MSRIRAKNSVEQVNMNHEPVVVRGLDHEPLLVTQYQMALKPITPVLCQPASKETVVKSIKYSFISQAIGQSVTHSV